MSDKPKFKVDDWVKDIYSADIHKVVQQLNDAVRVTNIRLNATYATEYKDIVLWTPKKNEWYWF